MKKSSPVKASLNLHCFRFQPFFACSSSGEQPYVGARANLPMKWNLAASTQLGIASSKHYMSEEVYFLTYEFIDLQLFVSHIIYCTVVRMMSTMSTNRSKSFVPDLAPWSSSPSSQLHCCPSTSAVSDPHHPASSQNFSTLSIFRTFRMFASPPQNAFLKVARH